MVIRLVPVLGKPALAAERTADESPDCRKREDERSGRGCQGARRRAQGPRRRRTACLRPAGRPTVSPPRTGGEGARDRKSGVKGRGGAGRVSLGGRRRIK